MTAELVERRRELEAQIAKLEQLRELKAEKERRIGLAKGEAWLRELQPKQQLAQEVSANVDELLYGGAAGGG